MSDLDGTLNDLLREYVEEPAGETERERALAREVRRLKVENKRLREQHDFAFASWQQAVKRSGRLSADLEAAKLEVARARTQTAPHLARGTGPVFGEFSTRETHEAVTIANAGAAIPPRFSQETAGTRIFKHSGGAIIVKSGQATGQATGESK